MTKCNVKGVKGRVEETFLYFEVTENVWYCNYSLHDKVEEVHEKLKLE